jgi:hypothetical protein
MGSSDYPAPDMSAPDMRSPDDPVFHGSVNPAFQGSVEEDPELIPETPNESPAPESSSSDRMSRSIRRLSRLWSGEGRNDQ